ncbi:GntR family transcriptional regulator [Rhizobium lusitanum]|uniref:GntR family transcriptional regulator n=1 Tax=Rhizobium lusitanum TaxID=293958 RepID=A0A6L9UK46_9HYPH|nr:GntR family transcriptional regulator [Rhizobium lusitanum]NEI74467.1 GntR family transcriptional regulator [Rhizobium lusitanum]
MLDTQSPFLSSGAPDTVAITEDKLKYAIISGALAPCERLSEIEVCRDYRVGRGIVRAALGRLAHSGFVSSQPRSGWKVASISAIGLREVILGRRQLEPLLGDVELSSDELMRLETLSNMHAALAAAQAQGLGEDIVSARRYDRQIRHLLTMNMKAPLIAGWLENLWDKSDRYLAFMEAKGGSKLPVTDWSAFVEAKRSGGTIAATAFLTEACEAFARFTQTRFLESDASAVASPTKKSKAAPGTDLSATVLNRSETNPKRTS